MTLFSSRPVLDDDDDNNYFFLLYICESGTDHTGKKLVDDLPDELGCIPVRRSPFLRLTSPILRRCHPLLP